MRDNEFKHRQNEIHIELSNDMINLIKQLQQKGVSKKTIRQLTGVGYSQQKQIKSK